MPLWENVTTGGRFRPHIVIASNSVHNRVTVGQPLEGFAALSVYESSTFTPAAEPRKRVPSPIGDEAGGPSRPEEVKECLCLVHSSGRVGNPMRPVLKKGSPSGSLEPVVCNCGICHIWQLAPLVRDKQHYLSSTPKGPTVRKGKL